MEWIISNY